MTAITPVINPPQAAILGVGAIRDVLARGVDGEIVDRQLLTLTLSCDHRILYGADAAQFLAAIRSVLESPAGAGSVSPEAVPASKDGDPSSAAARSGDKSAPQLHRAMGYDRTLLLHLATSRRLERGVKALPGGEAAAWRAASRYVAGRTEPQALQTAAALLDAGHAVSVDLFGERVDDPSTADRVAADYRSLAGAIAACRPRRGCRWT